MKKNIVMLFAAIGLIGLLLVGFVVWKNTRPEVAQEEIIEEEPLAEADKNITAEITWSKVKDNTIVLSIGGLQKAYKSVAYEVSYETQGVVQGVTSRPLDILGMEEFTRDDIYLGTCSRNVCKPHTGVKKVSLVLEFTNQEGKRSQLTKDFDL